MACQRCQPRAKRASTLRLVERQKTKSLLGLCPSLSSSYKRGDGRCTCLWFQHVGHRHSSVHSHARHVAVREGLQQKGWFREERGTAWELKGEPCRLPRLPVRISDPLHHFIDAHLNYYGFFRRRSLRSRSRNTGRNSLA